MDHKVLFRDDIDTIIDHLNKTREHIDILVGYKTPLMNAVAKNRNDVIDVLIEYGCNVNIQNRDGWTALHFCCYFQSHNRDILEKLLGKKADPNITNINGSVPLHYAASHTQDVNIIHLLTLYSNAYLQDNHGVTPLMYACRFNKNIDVAIPIQD